MIRVLLIEDSPQDVLKIRRALAQSETNAFLEGFNIRRASSLGESLEILRKEGSDVILLDLGLPDSRDFDGIDVLKKEFSTIPIIVLTKQQEETLVAIEAVKRGAQDYFSKSHLSDTFSLDRIVRYAIERKKHEEELIAAREEALRASKAKSDFLSSMSHDIRTPLNCIIGVADLLSRDKLSEESANHVKLLSKASVNLLSLINNVLDLSKIESGQVKVRNTPFDLLETIEGVLDISSAQAHAKNLELVFKIEPDVPRKLIGDPEHLTQVLVNFLSNAVKFTKRGEVLFTISKASSTDSSAVLRFLIRDTGIGIPADKFSTIFESFTQVEQADGTMKKQGSGLGLSICKNLIELMNGKVSVQSQLGLGSLFEIDIPFKMSEKRAEPNVGSQLNLSGMEILVVDDNPIHSVILESLLQSWGATVHLTANARSAWQLAQASRVAKKKFDIAILDLRMPGVAAGGLELAAKIKGDVGSIVMMVPTNHRYGDMERIKEAGVAKYYFKPTKPEQLAKIIAEILAGDSKLKAPEPLEAAEAPQTKPLNLLVVDDSEDNRYLIQAFCKGSGFKLEMAEDGLQAVDKFKAQRFDLVLMDIQMPSMNGYEALSAIRAWETSEGKARVPILALTAFALKEEAERCLSAGFGAHITKPIRKDDLIHTIKKFAA